MWNLFCIQGNAFSFEYVHPPVTQHNFVLLSKINEPFLIPMDTENKDYFLLRSCPLNISKPCLFLSVNSTMLSQTMVSKHLITLTAFCVSKGGMASWATAPVTDYKSSSDHCRSRLRTFYPCKSCVHILLWHFFFFSFFLFLPQYENIDYQAIFLHPYKTVNLLFHYVQGSSSSSCPNEGLSELKNKEGDWFTLLYSTAHYLKAFFKL